MKKIIMIISVLALLMISACAQEEPEQPFPEGPGVPGEDPNTPDIFNGDDLEQVEAELPELVATVNGENILKEDVYNFQSQLLMQGAELSQEDTINTLIQRRLLLQEANSRDYEVTKEIVEELLTQQGITREALEAQGTNYEDFVEQQMNSEDIGLSMLQREKMQEIEVTDEQAQEFYEQNAEQIEEPYEEIKDLIKNSIARQQVELLLQNLILELEAKAEIEKHY